MFLIENLSDKADNLAERNAILAKKLGRPLRIVPTLCRDGCLQLLILLPALDLDVLLTHLAEGIDEGTG